MKKRNLTILLLLLALSLSLFGCGKAQEQPAATEAPAAEEAAPAAEEPAQPEAPAEPESEPEEEAQAFPFPEVKYAQVETPYGTLQFPDTYVNSLTVVQGEGEIYNLVFSAEVSGKSYDLFTVYIGAEPEDVMYFGQVTDASGTVSDVYIQPHDLGDLSALSAEDQDQLYSMQEALNELLLQ